MSDGHAHITGELDPTAVSESDRLEAKARLLRELGPLNLTERQQLLAARFVCRPDLCAPPDRQEYMTIRRGIVGDRRARMTNRCRFDSSLCVDEEHIAGYCCNPGFAQCPFWRSKDELERLGMKEGASRSRSGD